jgi:hypothetical protein
MKLVSGSLMLLHSLAMMLVEIIFLAMKTPNLSNKGSEISQQLNVEQEFVYDTNSYDKYTSNNKAIQAPCNVTDEITISSANYDMGNDHVLLEVETISSQDNDITAEKNQLTAAQILM